MSFENRRTAGAFGVEMIKPPPHMPDLYGSEQRLENPKMRGVWKMGYGLGTTDASISDGTANTMMVSEVVGYDSAYDARGCWVLNMPGSAVYTAKTGPNSKYPDVTSVCYERSDDGYGIPEGHRLFCTENRRDGNMWAAARSSHVEGVNVAMCDGSVEFIANDVELTVWQAMATRAGGEVHQEPE